MALDVLRTAETVAVSIHALCEFVWVLEGRYGADRDQIAASIRVLTETSNVLVNRAAVDAGLRLLEAGGDFADGAIAFDGQWLGGETFVSFDRKAMKLLEGRGIAARYPPQNAGWGLCPKLQGK